MNNDTNNMNGEVLGSVNPVGPTTPVEPTAAVPPVSQEPVAPVPPVESQVITPTPVEPVTPPVMEQPVAPVPPVDSQVVTPGTVPPPNGNVMDPNNVVSSGPEPAPAVMETPPQGATPPAYTNPTQIENPSPMPGFENPGNIGTTPPISLEPDKQPKKKSSKVLFVILILVLLAAIGFGVYYVLNYTDLLNKGGQVKIELVNKEIELGSEVSTNITDYATITGTDSKNCSLDVKDVDSGSEGTYNYTVTCGETVKNGVVTVVKPKSEVSLATKTVYKTKDQTIEASEFMVTVDSSYTYTFDSQEEVEALLKEDPGTHTVTINVNTGGETKEARGKLVVLEYPIKGYLSCTSNSQNVDDLSAQMTVTEKFAIIDDGSNGYGKIATEIYSFVFTDETKYSEYANSTDSTVTINGITGTPTYSDSDSTVKVSNEKTESEVNTSYGEEHMSNYVNIKSYFEETLGYKCIYEKAN